MNVRRFLGAVLFCSLSSPAASAPQIDPAAGPEVVFEWAVQRCDDWDIPDAPARAWRDATGRVHLVAGSENSRAANGPDLDTVSHRCAVLHRGAEDDDPATWNDRSWIAAVTTQDGQNLTALAHVEYHGNLRPEGCPSGRYDRCWFNAIVELQSTDGGNSFNRRGGATDLVAALPWPYPGETAHRTGYFNPSNILRQGDWLFAFVFAEAAGVQSRGPCLLRRPLVGTARDWRGWDGKGFGVRFLDPYRDTIDDPFRHVCQPVRGIVSTISSVVRHNGSGHFVAVTPMVGPDATGNQTSGIFWSTSPDLLNWSTPQLLYAVPLMWRRDCSQPVAYAYPSLIDPDSAGRDFATADDGFWLYLTRMELDRQCRITQHRDLVRLPVIWLAEPRPAGVQPRPRVEQNPQP